MKIEGNKIYNMDCILWMKKIEDNSIDLIITDPPYNYEFLNHNRNTDEIDRRIERVKDSKTLVKNIPYWSWLSWWVRNERWYEKNYNNIIEYSNWCKLWWQECLRILKPWGFALVFNSARTVAHVQVALESVGFYARDILVWRRNSWIPKWINFSNKLKELWDPEYDRRTWWHSCLRQEWEGIVVVQKHLINNYQTTVKEYWVWLFHAEWLFDWFKSNIFEDYQRDKKDEFNSHCTVKPIKLIEDLIKITVPIKKSNIVLDPFMWSWTTAVACENLWISYLWFEINDKYYDICIKRLESLKNKPQSLF